MKKLIQITYVVLAIAILAQLTGCKFGPNFESPTPVTNANYMFDTIPTDSAMNLSWWELFNDTVLDTLVKMALDSNKDILVAAARIEESRAILGLRKGEALPAIGYQGQGNYGNFAGFYLPEPNGNGSGGMNLNWEIDFWGKYRRATESARADLLANQYSHRMVQISMISEVSASYFNLLDYQWRKIISEETVELRKENVDIIKQKFDNGLVPEIDLNNAELQYAIAMASVPQYERLIAFEMTKLSVLLGTNPREIIAGVELELQEIPPSIPPGLPSELLLRRPDIQFSEAQYHSQMAKIGVAQANRFPSISLTGFLGGATNALAATAGGIAWNVGGALTGPIFQFGVNKRRVEIERARTIQMQREYEKTVITAFKEVEDALISIATFTKELEAREIQAKSAVNAQTLSQFRYDKGVTSYLEVITLQGYAFEAELQLSNTRASLFNAYIALYKALGGGWISEEEKKTAEENNEQPNDLPKTPAEEE